MGEERRREKNAAAEKVEKPENIAQDEPEETDRVRARPSREEAHRHEERADMARPESLLGMAVEEVPARVRRVLSNSFGFGGSNCSLVLGAG